MVLTIIGTSLLEHYTRWKEMGITRVFVRSVFSKNRSPRTQETNASSSGPDKKGWNSVRSFLCGDEFNSVLAEEDSTSVKGSEATVTQPIPGDDCLDKGAIQSEEPADHEAHKEVSKSTSQLFRQEDAAVVIQTAFRNFLARRQSRKIKLEEDLEEPHRATRSPSGGGSVGTSVEVQTGNSTEVVSVTEENRAVHCRMQKKPRVQMLKLKEDWDDSTVSSSISKMRLQNRLEATNRRERALAYAFAQQLRICSRRKQARSDEAEPSMSWTWLERWMATRTPESSSNSQPGKQLEPPSCSNNLTLQKRLLDVAIEEKESCGSNDIRFDSLSPSSTNGNDVITPAKTTNRLKATRTISRRKTVPSYQYQKDDTKVNKGVSKEIEQEREHKLKQPSGKDEVDHMHTLSPATSEVTTSNT